MRAVAGQAPGRTGGALVLTAWLAALIGTLQVLTVVGHGRLGSPPLTAGAHAFQGWAAARDAPTIAMATVRVIAVALAWYLLVATAAGWAARLTRLAAAVKVTDAVTVPSLRRLLGATVGLALLAVPVAGCASTSSARPPTAASTGAPPPGPPVLRLLPDDPSPPPTTSVPRTPPTAAAGPPATSTPALSTPALPTPALSTPARSTPALSTPALSTPAMSTPAMSTSTGRPTAPLRPKGPSTPAAAPTDSPAARPTTWTVRPGDSFWHVARTLLTDAHGRPPTDAEIVPYWRSLIEVNRSRLDDPHNPDLLFPGQELTVTRPPGAR